MESPHGGDDQTAKDRFDVCATIDPALLHITPEIDDSVRLSNPLSRSEPISESGLPRSPGLEEWAGELYPPAIENAHQINAQKEASGHIPNEHRPHFDSEVQNGTSVDCRMQNHTFHLPSDEPFSLLFNEPEFNHTIAEILDGATSSRDPESYPTPRQSAMFPPPKNSRCDSDDPSWDEEDHEGEFLTYITGKLEECSHSADGFYLTGPLRRHQRRVVHAAAHMRRLSHLRVDDSGGDKRVLVSRLPIDFIKGSRKPYNFSVHADRARTRLLPTCIIVHYHCEGSPEEGLSSCLEERCLPFPYQLSHHHAGQLVILQFHTPGRAAAIVDAYNVAGIGTTNFLVRRVE